MPNKKGKKYFTQETEDAIVRYNQTDDRDIREQIYRKHIHQAFDKLVENIINRFKFPYIKSSFYDLKNDVISFLVLNIHKFDSSKGKAFSYFSVVAKNYLILHNNNRYKLDKKSIYLSETSDDHTIFEETLVIDDVTNETYKEMAEFNRLMVEFWDHNLTRIFKKNRDVDIANAIIELFRQSERIENFNKKALYLMIREMTGHNTSAITRVVNKMSRYMMQHLEEFKESGTITEQPPFFIYN